MRTSKSVPMSRLKNYNGTEIFFSNILKCLSLSRCPVCTVHFHMGWKFFILMRFRGRDDRRRLGSMHFRFLPSSLHERLFWNILLKLLFENQLHRNWRIMKAWILACRPWSFTAAVVPLLVGAALARMDGYGDFLLLLLTLLGGVTLQAATNMQNSCDDFRRGVDSLEYSHGESPIVLGMLSENAMRRAALALFAAAFAIGLLLAFFCGWPVLMFGIIGIIGGYGYTGGRLSYKYIALGPLMVFLLMGPLMVMASYYVQIGMISWKPFFVGCPIGFLVAAIMHANDVRDIDHDREVGISTLAIRMGFSTAWKFYGFLVFGAYLSLIIFVEAFDLPLTAALPFFLLVRMIPEMCSSRRHIDRARLELLDEVTAKHHFAFGLLFSIGLALPSLVEKVQGIV